MLLIQLVLYKVILQHQLPKNDAILAKNTLFTFILILVQCYFLALTGRIFHLDYKTACANSGKHLKLCYNSRSN